MNIQNTDEGKLVELPLKPEWGPGKIIKFDGKYSYVRFKSDPEQQPRKFGFDNNPLQLAGSQSDPVLDRLNLGLRTKSTRSPKTVKVVEPLISLEKAKEIFSTRFPGKFDDSQYIGTLKTGERFYKLQSVQKYEDHFGQGQLSQLVQDKNVSELAARAKKVIQSQNLTFVYENLRFFDVLNNPEETLKYFDALDKLLGKPFPTGENLVPYFDTVKAINVAGFAKWPNATLFPFLAKPQTYIFLKPKVTKDFAKRLGYDLKYDVKPNWETYGALLSIANDLKDQLADWNPKDMIDIQSFIWVLMEYHKTR